MLYLETITLSPIGMTSQNVSSSSRLEPSIAMIEQIARSASAATLSEVTQQQAVMVEKMTTLTERITELADLMKTSFVRKEEYYGMKDRVDSLVFWQRMCAAAVTSSLAAALFSILKK